MKNSIDDVLKPYADEQPEKLSMQYSARYKRIERIPPIVDHNGVTEEFQKFYNTVVEAITANAPKMLYDISDKAYDEDEFIKMFNSRLGNTLVNLLKCKPSRRGIDIELNLGRFKSIHRNIIGGFYVAIYMFEEPDFAGISIDQDVLVQKHTELLWTYKEGKFVVISDFKEFMVD